VKNIYFLDTSYVLALEIKNDNAHQQVRKNWATLATSKPSLVTTTYIFDEVVTFLNSRNLHHKAVSVGNRLRESPDIELVEIDKILFDQGWQYFQKYQDKSYSFTDCLSFVVMQNRKILTALTLDNHFSQARFETLPF
jgi:uncharacterized protein